MQSKFNDRCACGSENLFVVWNVGEVDFIGCKSCSLIFRKRFPSDFELEAIYSKAYSVQNIDSNDTNQESTLYALRKYAEFVKHRFKKIEQKSVLDFGSGTGLFVSELRKITNMVSGIEYSRSAREFCEDKFGFSLFPDLTFCGDVQYELVTMIEVIEHLKFPDADLMMLRSKMANQGLLLITTPNRFGFRAIIERGNWREARKKFHLVLFTKKSLRKTLERNGFSNITFIRFPPVQKPGVFFYIYSRLTQVFMIPGTLFAIATKTGT